MNTKTAWIAVVVVLILALAWYALSANKVTAPTETESSARSSAEQAEEATESPAGVTVVTLTNEGFSPMTITVTAGDTVRFVNESSRSMWVGSDDHPTHTNYDGTTTREHCIDGVNATGTFDQCTAVSSGNSWEYTFLKSGTFGYHNHTGAANTGTVIVQ